MHSKKDWEPWDIRAELGKKGYTLSKLARENGLSRTSPSQAFRRPWARMERLIAEKIGVSPAEIWPSRYGKGESARSPQKREKKKYRIKKAPAMDNACLGDCEADK